MSLTVKAYVLKQGEENPEIRRFAVDQDVSTSYAYLRGKVIQMFPALKTKGFELFWKDNENDLIAFSSDDELTEALGFVTDGVFKTYIKETGTKTDQPTAEPDVLHPGVICDVCDGPVRGFRFKCLVCPDYDLCSTCEGRGGHPEHDMMRISTPRQTAWMGFGGMFPPPPMYHGGQGPPPPGFCPNPGAGGPPPGPWGPCGGPGGRGKGRGGAHWRRMMNRWQRWMTGEEGAPNKGKDGDGNMGKSEDTRKEKEAKKSEDGGRKDEEGGSGDEDITGSPTEDFLRNVGQNVAAMLDPLGIDVEIDVEHKGNKKSCGSTGQCPGGPMGPMGWWMGAGGHNRHHSNQGPWCPWNPPPMPTAAKKPTEQKNDQKDKNVEMETGETALRPQPAVAKAADEKNQTETATMDTEELSSSQAGGATGTDDARPKMPSPDKEWTFIDNRSPPEAEGGQTVEGATEALYPQVPEPPVEPRPTDSAIANALDHMNAMGFHDEGGWLTRLLEVTGGDINKALDAIRANRNK